MNKFNYEQILELIGKAYVAGCASSLEMRLECVEELLIDANIIKQNPLKIFSVRELHSCKVGTKFHHLLLGDCEIAVSPAVRGLFMSFANGQSHTFGADVFPWTIPMIRIDQ